MASPDELPEFVRDSKLRTEIQGNQTIHTRPTARRSHSRREIWKLEGIIGQGGGGVVLLQRQSDGSNVGSLRAVKRIQLNTGVGRNPMSCIRRFVRELEASAKFSQKKYEDYFVKSYGWYHTIDEIYITMEYCKLGDLGGYLRQIGTMPEDEAKDVIHQVVTALRMMHVEGFAHRDLKPSNILVVSKPPDSEWWVKLCDLGLSRRSSDASGTTTLMGTPQYMAPEMIGGRFSGEPTAADPARADIWCLGETLFQTLTGSKTFDDETLYRYQKSLEPFPVSRLERLSISQDGIDFIRSLMAPDPRDRPDARQALLHAWMPTDSDSSISNKDGLTLLSKHERPTTSSAANIVLSDRLTQASGQWTMTSPISHFTGAPTQASGQWTTTIGTSSRFSASALNEIAHRLPGNAKEKRKREEEEKLAAEKATADAKASREKAKAEDAEKKRLEDEELERMIAEMEAVDLQAIAERETAYAEKARKEKEEKARRDTIGEDEWLKKADREAEERETAKATNETEEEKRERENPFASLKKNTSFQTFIKQEKQRLSERPKSITPEARKVKLNDLKKFSQAFKLQTPVPQDLFPILAKDERRQQQIVEKALLHVRESGAKNEELRSDTPSSAEKVRGVAGLPLLHTRIDTALHPPPPCPLGTGMEGTTPRNPGADFSLASPVLSGKEPPKRMTWAEMAAAGRFLQEAPANSELQKPVTGLAQSATSSRAESNSPRPTGRKKSKKKRAGTINSVNHKSNHSAVVETENGNFIIS